MGTPAPWALPPKPHKFGPRDKDQYNFIDPDSRMMKHRTHDGFDQHYNAHVAVAQDTLRIVASTLSHHLTDHHDAAPTLDAIAPAVGTPDAVALDNRYFSEATLQACAQRGVEPYIASGPEPHHQTWRSFFAEQPEPPPRRRQPESQDGLQTANRDWPRHLSPAQWIHVLLVVLQTTLHRLGDAPSLSLTALAQRIGVAETNVAAGVVSSTPSDTSHPPGAAPALASPLLATMAPNGASSAPRIRLNRRAVIAARKHATR